MSAGRTRSPCLQAAVKSWARRMGAAVGQRAATRFDDKLIYLVYERDRRHPIRSRGFADCASRPWTWIDCNRPIAMKVTITDEPP